MFQIYLLTVLTNILAGHALAREFFNSRFEKFSKLTGFVNKSSYRIILGVVSILMGIINLFPVYENSIPVLGNFLPSLAGIGAGVLLLVEPSKSREVTTITKTTEVVEKTGRAFGPFSTIVGIISIIIGILHVLLAKVQMF